MRFLARQDQVPKGAVERAYVAGVEGIPWRSRNWWAPGEGQATGEFIIQREVNDSGNLYVPWSVNGRGELVLSTTSLMERPKAYHLPLELARGTVNRVRNQVAEWQLMGLKLTPQLEQDLRRMSESFSQAATTLATNPSADDLADQTIRIALDASDQLAVVYTSQAIASRRATMPALPTFFACRIDLRPLEKAEAAQFPQTFNSAMIAFSWRDIEANAGKFQWESLDRQMNWCREEGLRVLGGPLLLLDRHSVPDWMYLWEGDFDQIQASVVSYVRAVVERYRGKVHVWNCAARMNLECAIKLNEEERVRLVVAVIDELHRLDPRTPFIISFDQPWAEYLSSADNDFSPLHFADSLVRAELGLAGISLEMNFGYWPQGTLSRDWLEMNRLIDRWNLLGIPLLLGVTIASDVAADAKARVPVRALTAASQSPPTPSSQAASAERIARLALSKPFVHGFVWNEWTDAVPHEFANGGLFDASGKAKPVLAVLANLRKQFLT